MISFLLAVAPALAPTPALVPAPTPVVQSQESFRSAFKKAMKIRATDEMNRLVRSRKKEAIDAIIEICTYIGNSSSDELEAEIAALNKAWKAVDGGKFVDNMYELHSLMKPEFKKSWREIKVRYDKAHKRLEKGRRDKKQVEIGAAGLDFEACAKDFEKTGDKFYASQAWLSFAVCFNKADRGENANLPFVFRGYSRCYELREEIDLKDAFYHQCKEAAKALEYEGHGDPNKGQPAEAKAKRESESKNKVVLTTTSEVFEDVEKLVRPVYSVDGLYQTWGSIYLKGNNSTAEFGTMKNGPRVIRSAASAIAVDVDRDGKGDVTVPLTGNITPVTVEIGKGDEKREWSFLCKIGSDQDTYQGMRFNLAPTSDSMNLYIAPAGTRTGELNGTAFRVFDDNMDGIFGSDPIDWGHTGMVEGYFQRDMDSIHFAGDKRARPWSPLQKVGDMWYRIESEKAGTQFTAFPTEVETGKLKLSFKGGKPSYVIVKGVAGEGKDAYFDIATGTVEVPEGRYEVFCGMLASGKRQQKVKALMVGAKKQDGWKVDPGKTTTVELGGPFEFEFDMSQGESTVDFDAYSVYVKGRGGELYQRFWQCVPQPEASARAMGKKKGAKLGKLRPAGSMEEVNTAGDYRAAWFPQKASFDKKKKGDMEVQLFEKKNKLFGKVSSEWKQ